MTDKKTCRRIRRAFFLPYNYTDLVFYRNDPIELTMSEVDPTVDLAHLANLARLSFDPSTTESASTDLEEIIAMIDVMQDVDTEGVAPLSHPLDGVQRLRQDLINETDQREKFQHGAPSTAEGYYLVPRVVD